MELMIIIIFLVGYLLISLEHTVHINKAASALLTGVLCWSVLALTRNDLPEVVSELAEHLGDISGILFFLLGAMTIVELIDSHDGFQSVTDRITTSNKKMLLWIVVLFTFFLSSVLDNLTTAIVMTTLSRKLIKERKERLYFLGMIVIAANAGGAWSPIGDVTTTMLWIGGQISVQTIMIKLIVPSLICALAPLILISNKLKGTVEPADTLEKKDARSKRESAIVLTTGILALVFVPVFKTITGLPPYMGILFGLSILWILTELMHKSKPTEQKNKFSVNAALQRIDTSSILFFLGILISIAAMQSGGILGKLSVYLADNLSSEKIIVLSLGLLSSVIDNVPLVAAAIGMYDLSVYPMDHFFWEFLAYCCGTGGSILIIGSAAGVAVMGMEKIEFFWYVRNISLYAIVGYFAGAVIYILMSPLFH